MRIRSVSLVLLSTLLAAGCADSDAGETPSETPDASEAAPATDTPTEAESTEAMAEPESPSVVMGIQEGAGSNMPQVVARDQGFFADHGMEVEFVPLAGSALLASITSGDVQFFGQSPQMVGTAIQQGQPLQLFCGGVDTNWSNILAPADAGFPTVGDGASWEEAMTALEGKTLGLAALGATQEHWATALANAAGADADAITLVPVGVGPGAIAALDSGQIDALMGYSFVTEQLLARGDTVELFAFDDTCDDVLGGQWHTGMVATADWLASNPNTATALCDALGDAIGWFQDPANDDAVNDTLAGPSFGITDQAVRDQIMMDGGVLDTFSKEVDCDRLQRVIDFFVEYGTFQADPPVTCDNMIWTP